MTASSHVTGDKGDDVDALTSNDSILTDIPEDVLIEILVRVPGRDIVRNCVLVSRRLRVAAASPTLWSIKCELEDKYIPGCMPGCIPENFMRLYFYNPYNRNLIKNPCALGN